MTNGYGEVRPWVWREQDRGVAVHDASSHQGWHGAYIDMRREGWMIKDVTYASGYRNGTLHLGRGWFLIDPQGRAARLTWARQNVPRSPNVLRVWRIADWIISHGWPPGWEPKTGVVA